MTKTSRLREWRGERTLHEVAPEIGVSVAMLSRLERCEIWVGRETARRVCAATGLSLDDLLAPMLA